MSLLLDVSAWPELAEDPGDLDPELVALALRCVCGVERGDHMHLPPHGSEDGTCPAFVLDEAPRGR